MKSTQFQKDQEKHCYAYSITNSLVAFRERKYKNAEIHLENAMRSLSELQVIKNKEATSKYVDHLLKQARAGNFDQELMDKLYE